MGEIASFAPGTPGGSSPRPEARVRAVICGRPLHCKGEGWAELTIWVVRSSVRPVCAASMAAGPDGVRRTRSQSGHRAPGSDSASGFPGLRPLSDHHHPGCTLPVRSGGPTGRRDLSDRRHRPVTLSPRHDRPCDPGCLVGHSHGDDTGRPTLKQGLHPTGGWRHSVRARRITDVALTTRSLADSRLPSWRFGPSALCLRTSSVEEPGPGTRRTPDRIGRGSDR